MIFYKVLQCNVLSKKPLKLYKRFLWLFCWIFKVVWLYGSSGLKLYVRFYSFTVWQTLIYFIPSYTYSFQHVVHFSSKEIKILFLSLHNLRSLSFAQENQVLRESFSYRKVKSWNIMITKLSPFNYFYFMRCLNLHIC